MAALSVKVPRPKLIEALQASLDAELAKIDGSDRTALDALNTEYQAILDAWGKKVAQAIVKNTVVSSTNFWRSDKYVQFNVTGLDVPDVPERPKQNVVYQDPRKIAELQNAIKILSLSEEDFVNASTYKSVVQYL